MVEHENYIAELAGRIDLPADAVREAINVSGKIFTSSEYTLQYEKLKNAFFSCGGGVNFGRIVFFPESFYPDAEFYSPVRNFAERLSVRPAALFMTLYCLFSSETLLQYRAFHINDHIFLIP